ncbi:MAG TPA: NAD(P)H-dependent oxidoreductase subunit E [Bacteroidales bacterium]|nr:NAD(P)H-dependent oxidoreductase subunit E [Lentimicrobiaceae bacterium]HOH99595.1 NAD(P)H-dependent oxidoreductase subunit E [Bacteroidales bacterium]
MDQELSQILERYAQGNPDTLISILQEVQRHYGYLPEGIFSHIARHVGMAPSRVYGVATFYDQFRFEPAGRIHIRLCAGTSCHLEGMPSLTRELERLLNIKEGQVSRDGMFSFEKVQCLGVCGHAPVLESGGRYWEGVTPEKLREIIQELKSRPSLV